MLSTGVELGRMNGFRVDTLHCSDEHSTNSEAAGRLSLALQLSTPMTASAKQSTACTLASGARGPFADQMSCGCQTLTIIVFERKHSPSQGVSTIQPHKNAWTAAQTCPSYESIDKHHAFLAGHVCLLYSVAVKQASTDAHLACSNHSKFSANLR